MPGAWASRRTGTKASEGGEGGAAKGCEAGALVGGASGAGGGSAGGVGGAAMVKRQRSSSSRGVDEATDLVAVGLDGGRLGGLLVGLDLFVEGRADGDGELVAVAGGVGRGAARDLEAPGARGGDLVADELGLPDLAQVQRRGRLAVDPGLEREVHALAFEADVEEARGLAVGPRGEVEGERVGVCGVVEVAQDAGALGEERGGAGLDLQGLAARDGAVRQRRERPALAGAGEVGVQRGDLQRERGALGGHGEVGPAQRGALPFAGRELLLQEDVAVGAAQGHAEPDPGGGAQLQAQRGLVAGGVAAADHDPVHVPRVVQEALEAPRGVERVARGLGLGEEPVGALGAARERERVRDRERLGAGAHADDDLRIPL
jgi:hypothetical protein